MKYERPVIRKHQYVVAVLNMTSIKIQDMTGIHGRFFKVKVAKPLTFLEIMEACFSGL